MFETLRALLEHRGPDAKALVWAHNSHLGNAGATEMGWSGQTNLGELCRTAFGRDAVLIGQSTDRGTVAAADNWDEPMQVKSVLPSRADSWERLFLQAGQSAALYDWRGPGRAELRAALLAPRLERAIGVIYRPRTERVSHYFHAELGEQFDAWLWFEETRAVKPLHGPSEPGVPDTWPFAE
jgi:erythromycin esterase-like protein